MCRAILLISCPDQKGITASVAEFIFRHGGNIMHADQHIDEQSATFFMRIEWLLEGFDIARTDIEGCFKEIADKFHMTFDLGFSERRARIAIFVSKRLHCLEDILYRHKAGQLDCEIPLIISNHPDAKVVAGQFKVPFMHIEIAEKNKRDQEKKEIVILQKEGIDLVVLARYHQILSKDFVDAFYGRIINIHHSFLPAFAGKNPYGQAFEKGVKIIGATSHFVNERLDDGPIIEQDTVRISHRDSLEDLIRKGEDLEKAVLNRALRLALQKKILSYSNKTVIFD